MVKGERKGGGGVAGLIPFTNKMTLYQLTFVNKKRIKGNTKWPSRK